MTEAEIRNPYTRGTAVPKRAPQSRPAKGPRVVRKKTKAQRVAEEKRNRAQAIRAGAVVLVFFVLISFKIFSMAQLQSVTQQVATAQASVAQLQSENTRLTMQIKNNVSLDKVEEYAVNDLKMVKARDNQVNYVTPQTSDHVSVSGGKAVDTARSAK